MGYNYILNRAIESDTYKFMHLREIFGRENRYRTQIIYLILAAFFGLLGYPFTRTSAAPYFNAAYGSEYLSWAMIAAAILAIVVVVFYNRFAKRFALIPLCIATTSFIILVTLIFGLVMGHHPRWVALLYYAWSDVYIVILVEQFWSISNTLFDKPTAKKYYGIFITSGSVGGLVGNGLVARLAEQFGSGNMIFLCSISLGLFVLFIYLLHRSITNREELRKLFNIEHDLAESSTVGGASLVFRSRYLTLIALLILATQIYINGAYFIYNRFLDASTQLVDSQSALYGQIFFIIQIVTIFSAFILTPLSLKFLGVGKTHFSIIGVTMVIFGMATISPHLAFLALLFVVAKSFDYSIFRAAKEMFYLPLHVAEKFQAKSFIDVFVYRFSKAIAALGIILVGQILDLSIFFLVGFGLLLWLILITLILRIYKNATSGA